MSMIRLTILCLIASGPAWADAPVVEDVRVRREAASCQVAVTLRHPDTGWDHYADGWRVEDAEGNVLGTRVLAHPHVNEQPFTRCLGGMTFAPELTEVFVRARCSVDGWNETTTRVALPLR